MCHSLFNIFNKKMEKCKLIELTLRSLTESGFLESTPLSCKKPFAKKVSNRCNSDMARNIILPDLNESGSARDYFQLFVLQNKHQVFFSQRWVAKELNWPVSYLPDLLKGRKKFTITRALQFARRFRLDSFDMEKLIFLAIQDLHPDLVSILSISHKNKSKIRKSKTCDLDLLDAKTLLVMEYIRWSKGQITKAKLLELVSRQEVTAEEVLAALKLLSNKGLVSCKNGKFSSPGNPIFSDDFDSHNSQEDRIIHEQFSDFFKIFLRKKIGPAVYNNAIVHLHRRRFEELADKLVSLRNWILSTAEADGKLPFNEDVRLFQLDLSLTPLCGIRVNQEIIESRDK